ncbi:ABC transporter permease subunit [Streptomyces niveus]|uniref:ABC transporter permease subunit n=1 Tax=Streptomyces niveus TaxID=193462 RepID=UPI00342D1033
MLDGLAEALPGVEHALELRVVDPFGRQLGRIAFQLGTDGADLQGIGTLLITGITMRDIPVVQGVTLVVAVMVVVINLVVDILCFVIDPRLRKGLEAPS